MVENWPKKTPLKSRDEAPISIVQTAHFARKMAENAFTS
jgi:hypothetical protein